MNLIVYQAYGHQDFLNECLYSLYSLERTNPNSTVMIYTDSENYLKKIAPSSLKISYRKINKKEVKTWRGEHNFIHRLKVMILLDLLQKDEFKGNILYLDTDTKVIQNLDSIFDGIKNGNLFMHQDEGRMLDQKDRNPIFRKTIQYAQSNKKYANLIPLHQHMWNAGALGFTTNDTVLIKKVLSITDQIYSEYPKHIAEQLSFSIVFGQQHERPLHHLENKIFHYWNFKEFRKTLGTFFKTYINEETIKLHLENIDPEKLIIPKFEFERFSFFKKQIRKLFRKKH